jgi:hypothetical protein
MAINFHCPECREQFQVDDAYGGRQWRCSNCSAPITIPAGGDIPVIRAPQRPPPLRRRQEQYDDFEPPPDTLNPGWGLVRGGLNVFNIGMLIVLVSGAIFLILAFMTAMMAAQAVARGGIGAGPPATLIDILRAVTVVFFLGAIVSVILWVIGQSMCCAAPAESGGKGLAIGALICSVVGVLVCIIIFFIFMSLVNRPAFAPLPTPGEFGLLRVFSILAFVVWLAGNILFILFLRSVASFFENYSLATHIIVFMIVYLVITVVSFGLSFVPSIWVSLPFQPNPLGLNTGAVVLSLGLIVGFIGMLIWFVAVVSLARSVIPRATRYGRRPDYY